MKATRLITIHIAVLTAGLFFARADQQLTTPVALPVSVHASADETNCNNSPGPQITLSGEIFLGGINAKVTFSNNAKGTHTTNVVAQYTFTLLSDTSITIPKQPALGGVGGNPYIYLQFTDADGVALSQEFFLGRCVQGLEINDDLIDEAVLLSTVHTDGCSNKKGPYITLGGNLVLSGLNAKIIFRNNVKGTQTKEASTNVTLIEDGSSITIPKQPSRGGVGGNPLITIQFLHSDGSPIGEPVFLGRCNQI